MTIAYVGKSFVQNSTSGTVCTVPMPSGVVAGHKMYCLVGSVGATAGSLTVPAGWTLARELVTGSNLRGALCTRTAVAGDASASFAWTFPASGRNFGYVVAYSGVDLAAAELADATGSTTAGTGPWATPSLSLGANDWLITAGLGRETPGTATAKAWSTSDASDVERFDLATASEPSINITAALYDSGRALAAGSYNRSLTEAAATMGQSQVWAIRVPALVDPAPTGGNPWDAMGMKMR